MSTLCHNCRNVVDNLPRNYEVVMLKPTGYTKSSSCDMCQIIFSHFAESKQWIPMNTVWLQNFGGLVYDLVHKVILTPPNGLGVDDAMVNLLFVPESYTTIKHKIGDETADDNVWTLCNTWLRTCQVDHKCFPSRSGTLPKRLVRLELSGRRKLSAKLCLSHGLPSTTKYSTVSYRWPRRPKLTLTRANIDRLQDEIDLQLVPYRVLNVLYAAAFLGFTYVWVDSLCIIQDDENDWQNESAKMGDIYSGSEVNIAATGASGDEDTGCFFNRPERVKRKVVPPRVYGPAPGGGHTWYNCGSPWTWETDLEGAELMHRGWVIQERILAPRTLHFGQYQCYWECSELAGCEGFPSGMPHIGNDVTRLRARQTRQNVPTGSPDEEAKWWAQTVLEYSQAVLTYPKDSLAAISGLARHYQTATGDEYVAGLWRRHLEAQLTWSFVPKTHDPAPGSQNRPTYIAPTWSWACLHREVAKYSMKNACNAFSVRNVKITPSGADPLGPVKSASLEIQCRPLRRAQLPDAMLIVPIAGDGAHYWDRTLVSSRAQHKNYALLFDTQPPKSLSGVFMLFTSVGDDSKGLLLEATGQKGEYRRVGAFEIVGTGWGDRYMEDVRSIINRLPTVYSSDAYTEIVRNDAKGCSHVITLI